MSENLSTSLNNMGEGGDIGLPQKRDSNIELFRIITMLLIVAHHYVVNSGLTLDGGPIFSNSLSWRSLFLLIFGAWGKTGINCFVLITGYFMCKSQITMKKFLKLLLVIMFYRICFYLIFTLTGYEAFSFSGLIKTLIPITEISVGFPNAFLVFYLLIPFLSILVQHLNEKQHIYLLILCGFTYVWLGTIPGFSITMNYVSWFSVLFVIASYIRLYPKRVYENKKVWAWLTIGFILLAILSIIGVAWIGTKIGRAGAYYFVSDSNTFLAVAVAVCAFMFFRNIKIRYSKLINTIAASTFGVFLIHTRGDTMRQWLWRDLIDPVGHYGSKLMPLYAIVCVLAIFCICTVIDQLRIHFIEKPFFKFWDKHYGSIQSKYNIIEAWFLKKIGVKDY